MQCVRAARLEKKKIHPYLCQFKSNNDGTVGIVALPHIQNSGKSIGQLCLEQAFVVNDSVLGTPQRQNEGIARTLFCQLGEIRSIPLRSVAAPNEKDATECSTLGSLQNLSSQGQHRSMIETNSVIMRGFNGTGISLQRLGLSDYSGKVAIGANVLNSVDSHRIHGVQSRLEDLARLQDAVGGDDNGPRESSKLEFLILPGRSIIADQMLEFLEFGIRMGRQHFSMGINVDSGPSVCSNR